MDFPALDVDAMMADMDRLVAAGEARRAEELVWNQTHLLDADGIRAHTNGPARFNFLSLPAWLAVAQRAGVPFIPATEIASLSTDAFGALVNGEEHPEALAFLQAGTLVGADEMIRFEQCGPGSLKSSLSQGKGLSQGLYLHPDTQTPMLDAFDPRIYETYCSLGTTHLRAYKRPLVHPTTQHGIWQNRHWDGSDALEGDWPVEFRVFVREGQVTGVSNYYPQMTLPDTYLDTARKAAQMAQTLVAWMASTQLGVGNGELCADTGADEPERRASWVPDHWGPQDFTLDFLLSASGDLLFLEAGPGGFRQAAPCCFETGPMGDAMLTGVKLGLESPVHPLTLS